MIIIGFYCHLMWLQIVQQLSSDFPPSSRLSLCLHAIQRESTGECVRPPGVYFQRRASLLFGKATSLRSSFPSATALSRSVKGEETRPRFYATVRQTCAFSVHQFWVSDQIGPRDDAVRQPDAGSSLCVWRSGRLLCDHGLSAAGHLEDAFCCSGRTQGRC